MKATDMVELFPGEKMVLPSLVDFTLGIKRIYLKKYEFDSFTVVKAGDKSISPVE